MALPALRDVGLGTALSGTWLCRFAQWHCGAVELSSSVPSANPQPCSRMGELCRLHCPTCFVLQQPACTVGEADAVLCPAAPSRDHAVLVHTAQSSAGSMVLPKPGLHGSVLQLTRLYACSGVVGVGWGDFGFGASCCIPFKKRPSVFTCPTEGGGCREGCGRLQFGTKYACLSPGGQIRSPLAWGSAPLLCLLGSATL